MPKLKPSQIIVALGWIALCLYLGGVSQQAVAKVETPAWNYPFVKIQTTPIVSSNQVTVASPSVTMAAGVVIDVPSGVTLWQKQADEKRAPASTTKLMTALIARQIYTTDQVLEVPMSLQAEGTTLGLKPGERWTVQSLLAALLIASANDAAEVLAAHHPEGRAGFIAQMNRQADIFGLSETHFMNPTGLDETNHLSSANDLAKIAKYVISDQLLQTLTSTREVTIQDKQQLVQYQLKTTNDLLGTLAGIVGLKTGTTPEAGEVLVTHYQKDDRDVLIVVMGSTDRNTDTQVLLQWSLGHYQWLSASDLATLVRQ